MESDTEWDVIRFKEQSQFVDREKIFLATDNLEFKGSFGIIVGVRALIWPTIVLVDEFGEEKGDMSIGYRTRALKPALRPSTVLAGRSVDIMSFLEAEGHLSENWERPDFLSMIFAQVIRRSCRVEILNYGDNAVVQLECRHENLGRYYEGRVELPPLVTDRYFRHLKWHHPRT